MDINTSKTMEIDGSPLKMVWLALLSIALTVACIAIVAGYIPKVHADDWKYWVAALGVLFFGFTTVMTIWRAVTMKGPVVTMTPDGILDTRVAANPIPWSAVRGISTWSQSGQKIMVLDVDPAVEKTLPLTRIARWSRGTNKKLGADGLCVTAQGLKTSYPKLLDAATAYARVAHARSA